MEAQRIRRLGMAAAVLMGRALKRIHVIPTSIRQRGWRLPSMSSFQILPPSPPLLPAMLHLLQGRAAKLLAPRLWADRRVCPLRGSFVVIVVATTVPTTNQRSMVMRLSMGS
jgi:hypothetical protein